MSDRNKSRAEVRVVRHRRVRAKVSGTAARPRLAIFRSAGHIYAQIIDDVAGKTVVAASDLGGGAKEIAGAVKEAGDRQAKLAKAFAVGKSIASKAKAKGVTQVVFDRGGFAYSGRVQALADGARDGGLEF